MLIAFGMPAVSNITLTGGTWTGPAGDTWQALVDGQPARVARITRSGTVTLTLALARAVHVQMIALLGLKVPAGTAVTAGGTGTVTHEFPDGTVGAFIHRPSGASVSSIVITIAGSGQLDIGEIAVMRCAEIAHEPGFSDDLIDPSQYDLSRASQPSVSLRVPYRRLVADFTAEGVASVRGQGLGGTDWMRVRAALAHGRCIAIPRYDTASELHSTAIYGQGRITAINHRAGNWHGAGIEVQEVPAVAV